MLVLVPTVRSKKPPIAWLEMNVCWLTGATPCVPVKVQSTSRGWPLTPSSSIGPMGPTGLLKVMVQMPPSGADAVTSLMPGSSSSSLSMSAGDEEVDNVSVVPPP